VGPTLLSGICKDPASEPGRDNQGISSKSRKYPCYVPRMIRMIQNAPYVPRMRMRYIYNMGLNRCGGGGTVHSGFEFACGNQQAKL